MSIDIEYTIQNDRLIIAPGEALDNDLPQQIRRLVPKDAWEQAGTVAIDFSNISAVSSKELGALALLCADEFFKVLDLRFCNVAPDVYQSLCLIGIDQIVTVERPGDDGFGGHEVGLEARAIFHDCLQKGCPFFGRKIVSYVKKAEQIRCELEETRRELEKAKTQLIHSEKLGSLGQLAGGVAHEFNNLIAIMKGFVEMAQAKPDDAKVTAKAIEVVAETVDRAAELTEGLLSFSRRRQPSKSEVDINLILRKQLDMMHNECMAHKVEVETEFADGVLTLADASQLQQVLLNLCTNAIHAMPAGGTLRVSTEVGDQDIRIKISDTGVGIPPENLNRIFTPFFTTKGAIGGGEVKGTGLGLSVSYGIISSHGGKIDVKSEVGKGTTFTIVLPKRKEKQRVVRPVIKKSTVVVPTDRPLTVLVVDDEERIRQLLVNTLKHMGHKVIQAEDGLQAIEICKDQRPDFIFLDILMPKMNGGDALLEIRKLYPDVAVTVVTGQEGKALQAMLELMRQAGSVNVIRKPFSLHDIRQAIRDFQGEGADKNTKNR